MGSIFQALWKAVNEPSQTAKQTTQLASKSYAINNRLETRNLQLSRYFVSWIVSLLTDLQEARM
jgi:hypothetical protein